MIKVNNLTKEFKTGKKYEGFKGALKSLFSMEYIVKTAVDNMCFEIKPGELVGYIGVNGAGKSTTIKMMTGILTPSSGSCTVDGIVPYEKRKENAKNIGVVFGQRTQLWWDLPVSESFSILQRIYDVPKEKFEKNLKYLKDLLEIDDFYLTPVRNLSLGQKMRCEFAASLLHDPKVVFLDEPTIGLDVLVKDKIRKAIKQINKEKGTTFILTTHDIDDIEEICQRIIVIDEGKKIYDGSIKDLKEKYARYKILNFDIRENCHLNLNEIFNLNEDELKKKEEEGKLSLEFLKGKIDIGELISKVVSCYDVKDMTIEDTSMETIVKEIYQKKA